MRWREVRGRAGCLGVVGVCGSGGIKASIVATCEGISEAPLHALGKGGHRIALGALLDCDINIAGSEQNLAKSLKERKVPLERQDWVVTWRNQLLCLGVKMWGSESQEEEALGLAAPVSVWAREPWILDLECFMAGPMPLGTATFSSL